MRDKQFNGKKIILAGLGSLIGYDILYRLRHPLIQAAADEIILSDLKDRLDPNSIEWVEENNYSEQMDTEVLPYINYYMKEGIISTYQADLNYSIYLKSNQLPTIFIVHGFNEYKEKYRELVYYFLQLDYNVVVYDARGHGSSRVDPTKSLIDVQNFNDYVDDLNTLINLLVDKHRLSNHLFLFGHSMGGAVSTAYLYEHPHVFRAAVLSSPMLSIETQPYPRSISHATARLATILNMGDKPLPAQGSNKIVEASTDSDHFTLNKDLSHSIERSSYYFALNRAKNSTTTSGGSLSWLKASLNYLNFLTKKEHLREITTPSLIFRSVEDRVVRPEGIYTAAKYIPDSQLIAVEGVGHEIYQETDQVVRPYVSLIADFFEQYR